MPAFQESNYEDNSTLSVSDTSYQSKNEKFNYHKKNAWDPSVSLSDKLLYFNFL